MAVKFTHSLECSRKWQHRIRQDSPNLHFVEDRRALQAGAGLQTVPVVEGVEEGCLAVAGGLDRPFATAEGRYKTKIGIAALTVN